MSNNLTSAQALRLAKESKKLVQRPSGKVRELFDLTDYSYLFAPYVTDRWSARDFIFGFPMPTAGIIRNAMTISWKRRLRKAGFRTDLVAYGRVIDEYLPPELRGIPDLWKRLTIVHKYDMIPYELIYRFVSAGGLAQAAREGRTEFCGHVITPDMKYGYEFVEPFATPSTKALSGHDEDVSWQQVERDFPGLLAAGSKVVTFIRDQLAASTEGNIIDIKIEMAQDPQTGEYVLCDEVSPDSCRFCRRTDYPRLLQGEKIGFLDKEFGRGWADSKGIRELNPKDPADCEFVSSWEGPDWFVQEFITRYEEACRINTGYVSSEYLQVGMNL